EKYTAAITDFNVAIRLEPDAADAYLNRGTAKESLRQHVAAISDYNTAIRLKPNYIKAYYNRGVSKVRLGQRSEAKQDFQIVLRLAIKAGDTGFKVSAEKALRKLEE
ncbi:tetratricopeptide repeat protein, partial [Candidatus Poribacteria bacterium]|nr:tetratricopeptide repeat protein [Candidatus Poribacteria bacterium]